MPRTPIVLCVLAFLTAAFLGVLRFQSEQARERVEVQLAAESARAARLTADLTRGQAEQRTLASRVSALDSDLADARAKFLAASARATDLELELAQTKAALAVHEANGHALTTELTRARQDLADTRATFVAPEIVSGFKQTIAALEQELAAVRRGPPAGANIAFANRAGLATVLSVGPQNAFVVLDFGVERGAQLGQKLEVNHGTDRLATVLISDVRPSLSIAQVLPDTLRGVLQKGDRAILLR